MDAGLVLLIMVFVVLLAQVDNGQPKRAGHKGEKHTLPPKGDSP